MFLSLQDRPFILELNASQTFVCKDIPVYDDCTVNAVAAAHTLDIMLQCLDESVADVIDTKETAVITVYGSDGVYVCGQWYIIMCYTSPNFSSLHFTVAVYSGIGIC